MLPLLCLVAAGAVLEPLSPPAPLPPAQEQRLAREILAQLVGMDTSAETGSTTTAAQAVAKRLRAAGFSAADVQVLGPVARKQNLVARLRGTGQHKPLLLLGHLDVVQALRSDWSVPPYRLTEQDGYFYGRGVQDMKGLVTYWVAGLLRLRREGFRPDR